MCQPRAPAQRRPIGTGMGFSPTPFLSLLCHARSLNHEESSQLVGLVSGLSPHGDEELYFCTEPFPGNAPSALRGRGKYRLCDNPVAAGHTPPLLPPTRSGSQPRPGPPGCRGRRLLQPRAPSTRCGSERSGKRGGARPGGNRHPTAAPDIPTLWARGHPNPPAPPTAQCR